MRFGPYLKRHEWSVGVMPSFVTHNEKLNFFVIRKMGFNECGISGGASLPLTCFFKLQRLLNNIR